jgi:hypothetical protein
MKKLVLALFLLTSIIAIGQKNNFYGESGKQYYKLKVDKVTFDLLNVQDGTIFFNNGMQGDCLYDNGVIIIKDLFYLANNELRLQNNYQKQDDLNYSLNNLIQLDIQLSLKIQKIKMIFKPFIGYSKDDMKVVLGDEDIFRESSNFVWLTTGIILNFDTDGRLTDIDYKKI